MTARNNIRKIFTVVINKNEYDVFDIDSKEHDGYNDVPKTWWLYHSSRLPSDLLPPIDSDYWKPYNAGILRRLWDIRITQHNTTKEKWDDTRFNSHTNVEMWCNQKLIYSFGTGGKHLDYAMAKIQYLQVELSEHSFNFFEPESENGRKICWYGLPATIKVKSNTWEISIIPDYAAGLAKDAWWKEYANRKTKYTKSDDFDEMDREQYNEDKENDRINWGDALSDQHIYWFRK